MAYIWHDFLSTLEAFQKYHMNSIRQFSRISWTLDRLLSKVYHRELFSIVKIKDKGPYSRTLKLGRRMVILVRDFDPHDSFSLLSNWTFLAFFFLECKLVGLPGFVDNNLIK